MLRSTTRGICSACGHHGRRAAGRGASGAAAALARRAYAGAAAPSGAVRPSAAAAAAAAVRRRSTFPTGFPARRSFHGARAARKGDEDAGSDNLHEAGEHDFDRIMTKVGKEGKLVLVDFYADWCMPCRLLGPTITKVAAEEGVPLVKVNTDEAGDLAMKYDVSALPTVASFKEGKKTSQFTGARDEAFIRDFIKKNV